MNNLVPIIHTERGDLAEMNARLGLRDKMDLDPVITTVQAVSTRCALHGDAAVLELTARFDKVRLPG